MEVTKNHSINVMSSLKSENFSKNLIHPEILYDFCDELQISSWTFKQPKSYLGLILTFS